MPSLTELVVNRASVDVPFDNGVRLHVEYYPERVTVAFLQRYVQSQPARLAALPDTTPDEEVFALIQAPADLLLELLAGWDLTADGSVEPLPITAESIGRLGILTQRHLLAAILTRQNRDAAGEAQAPGESSSVSSSGATSQPMAS